MAAGGGRSRTQQHVPGSRARCGVVGCGMSGIGVTYRPYTGLFIRMVEGTWALRDRRLSWAALSDAAAAAFPFKYSKRRKQGRIWLCALMYQTIHNVSPHWFTTLRADGAVHLVGVLCCKVAKVFTSFEPIRWLGFLREMG